MAKKQKTRMREGAERSARNAGVDERPTGSLHERGSGETVHLVLSYLDREHECLSDWEPNDLKGFAALPEKLRQMTWQQVLSSGGKGNKKGLGYTKVKSSDLPRYKATVTAYSEDLTWAEMRVNGEARVFGFRFGPAFYVVFLDAKHKVFSE